MISIGWWRSHLIKLTSNHTFSIAVGFFIIPFFIKVGFGLEKNSKTTRFGLPYSGGNIGRGQRWCVAFLLGITPQAATRPSCRRSSAATKLTVKVRLHLVRCKSRQGKVSTVSPMVMSSVATEAVRGDSSCRPVSSAKRKAKVASRALTPKKGR